MKVKAYRWSEPKKGYSFFRVQLWRLTIQFRIDRDFSSTQYGNSPLREVGVDMWFSF